MADHEYTDIGWWTEDSPNGQIIGTARGLTIWIGDVTPKMAERMMTRNMTNRGVAKGTVKRFAGEMGLGEWLLTHQPIGVDTNHEVIDGQHRLLALIESGHDAPFIIVFGLSPETRYVVDIGRRRSHLDIAHVTGHRVSQQVMQTAQFTATRFRPRPQTERQVQAFLRTHEPTFIWAVEQLPHKSSWMATPQLWSVLARARASHPEVDLVRFATLMATGFVEPQEPRDSGAIKFREWRHREVKKVSGSRLYWYAEEALSAYLEGRVPRQVREAENELFPLPGEQMALPKGRKPTAKSENAEST